MTTSLPSGATVYWRVRANLPSGPGQWSGMGRVITAAPPATPTLLWPDNRMLIRDYTPLLDWSTVGLPSGTVFSRYALELARDSAFTDLILQTSITGLSTSKFQVQTSPDPDRRYYWRVRSFNTKGQYSPWATRSFRTALLPPIPLEPANDGLNSVHTKAVTFKWNDPNPAGVTGYTVQVSKARGSSTILKTATVTEPGYKTNLPGNSVLYWRVRTLGANGPSAWSPVWSLLTGNPPLSRY